MKQKVLILCTGNSCRSQMAEGILRKYGSNKYEVYSAGSKPSVVNPTGIEVMREIGIDISGHSSKHLDEYKDIEFDYVITVCDNAKESCPVYLKTARKLHWPFPDPPHDQTVTEPVKEEFRKVRDLIHAKFKSAGENGIS
ncbi:MAG: arsenate reductase ArsC [Candidatus Omnitrophica bacterium]|nr:arsenate reductase ArsC [Candidatus Omnitrophota bacterium]